MLFDLFSIAKVSIIFIYPNKILLFIENLCYCSLKISGRVPKISVRKKKIKIPSRLKITEWSKNYGLKIPVRVCMCTRIYARASDCGQMIIRTHDHDQHTPPNNDHQNTGHQRTRGNHGKKDHRQREKPAYIGKFAENEKKYKKVKKNLEI